MDTRNEPDSKDSALAQSGQRIDSTTATEHRHPHDAIVTVHHDDDEQGFSWRKLLAHSGPGFLMCVAYIDPGNLEADLQTGNTTGYALLWVLLWSTAMGFLLQSLSARLGVTTGMHLAQHCRRQYSKPMRFALWLMAELAIIGSDIQEVIGTALALAILTRGALPIWAGVIAAAISAYFMLFLDKLGARWLERFFQVAVGVMAICMATLFFLADVPYSSVAKGLIIPSLPAKALPTAAGLLGSIIMPHNLYLHSALVHARPLTGMLRRPNLRESVSYYNIEAAFALLITLLINISVISVFARGFYGHRFANIGLQNAGEYLGKRFGRHVELIWAVGLLSSGQSSTMTGTYAGQHVMSGFFEFKLSPSARALMTRAVALVPTMAVALTAGNLDALNQWLNVLQSVQLPFVVVPLLAITSAPGIMGLGFVTSPMQATASWLIAAGIIAINLGTVWQTSVHHLPAGFSIVHALFWALVVGYVVFVAKLIVVSLGLRYHVPSVEEEDGEEDGLARPLLGSRVREGGEEEALGGYGEVTPRIERPNLPPRPMSPAIEAASGLRAHLVDDLEPTPP